MRPSHDFHTRRVTCVYQDEGLSKSMAQLLLNLSFRIQCPSDIRWSVVLSKEAIWYHYSWSWPALNPNWVSLLTLSSSYNSTFVFLISHPNDWIFLKVCKQGNWSWGLNKCILCKGMHASTSPATFSLQAENAHKYVVQLALLYYSNLKKWVNSQYLMNIYFYIELWSLAFISNTRTWDKDGVSQVRTTQQWWRSRPPK